MVAAVPMPDGMKNAKEVPQIPGNLYTPITYSEADKEYKFEGVSLKGVFERNGTCYVTSLPHIRRRFEQLKKDICYHKTDVLYAMKANNDPTVLRYIAGLGCGVDTTSPAEVLVAMKNGFKRNSIVYTANGMSDDDMAFVHSKRVFMNFDSLNLLERYGELVQAEREQKAQDAILKGKNPPKAKPVEISIRFDTGIIGGERTRVQTTGADSKFGIPVGYDEETEKLASRQGLRLDTAKDAKELAEKYGLKVTMVHVHTGSAVDGAPFVESAKRLFQVAEMFPDLNKIDLGGGLKVGYSPNDKPVDYKWLGEEINGLVNTLNTKLNREVTVCFEPGKYLVAESTVFLTKINEVKTKVAKTLVPGEEEPNLVTKTFWLTDAGHNQCARPTNIQDKDGNPAYHHVINVSNPKGDLERVDKITGKLCLSGDLFAIDRVMPKAEAGTVLALLNAGAYCDTVSSEFNLNPKAACVVVNDNGEEQVTRKALSYQQMARKHQREYIL
jgi:diaminopimelate decarboxylase